MTNRPDLWGHYGLAREIAALYGLPLSRFRPFPRDLPAGDLTVTVEDPERCPRYIGAEPVSYTHLDVYKRQEKLKKADEVAYVRFASVYRQFKDINTFMSELNKLLSEK